MRIRDVAIVVIGLAGSMFAWYQDGTISIRNSFVVPFTETDATYYLGPRPIVTDLDGDGSPEVVFTPSRDFVTVIPTWRIRRSYHDTFINLDRSKGAHLSGNAIGMAAGYLDFPSNETQVLAQKGKATKRDARKQVLAVVTDDYRLTVYTDGGTALNEVWSRAILPPLESTMVPYHASVRVVPYRLYNDDVGMVIVVVKAPGANGTEVMLHMAVSGQDGTVRWRHRADPYVGTAAASAEYKDTSRLRFTQRDLDVHAKETDWSKFRESIVASLPHSWSHPWDSRLDLHAFYTEKARRKHKERHDELLQGLRTARYKTRKFQPSTADDFGQIGERLTSARQGGTSLPGHSRGETPNTLVSHTAEGMDIIHMYTGRVITSISPLDKRSVFHDLDDDYHIDEVRTRVGSTQRMFGRHGVDEEVQCLGMITSGRPKENHMLYNSTICDTAGYLSGVTVLAHYLHGDEAREAPTRDALSLIGSRPVGRQDTAAVTPIVTQHQVFRGNGIFKVTRDAVFMIDTGLVTCVNPVQKRVLWRADTEAGFDPKVAASSGDAAGVLHSTDERQARTPEHHPHLVAYRFHSRDVEVQSETTWHHGNDPIVLAVGDSALVALNSKTGAKEATVPLPGPPVAPVLVADFNGDGINDILIMTNRGLFGLLVSHRTSGSVVTTLLVMMVLLLLLLYAAQSFAAQHDREIGSDAYDEEGTAFPPPPSRPVRVKRSTD